MKKQQEFEGYVNTLQNANEESIIEVFDKIADLLLNYGFIKVNEIEFQIREIEFYYYSENHKDIHTHKDEKQLTALQWYFHPYLDGIDLTIGNKDNTIYGGVLIRGIYDIQNQILFDGPANVLTILLNTFSKNAFLENTITLIFNDKHNKEKTIIVSSKRVGLKISEKKELGLQKNFINKPYRYLSLVLNYNNNTKREKYQVALDLENKKIDPHKYFLIGEKDLEKKRNKR